MGKRALHKRNGDEKLGGGIKRVIPSPLRDHLQLMFEWGEE